MKAQASGYFAVTFYKGTGMKQLTVVVTFLCLAFSAVGADRSELAFSSPDGFGFSSEISLRLHFRAPKSEVPPLETGAMQNFNIYKITYNIGWPTKVHLLNAEDGRGFEAFQHSDPSESFQNGFGSGGGELKMEGAITNMSLQALYILRSEDPNKFGTQLVINGLEGYERGLGFMAVSPMNEEGTAQVAAPMVLPMDNSGMNYAHLVLSVLPKIAKSVRGATKYNEEVLEELYPEAIQARQITMPNPNTTTFSCQTMEIRENVELQCSLNTAVYGSVVLDPEQNQKH